MNSCKIDEGDYRIQVENYMDGWKENQLQTILSCLDESIVIIESHGPIYSGLEQIKKWFTCWLQTSSQVLFWDIKSFYFCEVNNSVFYEWYFKYTSNGVVDEFYGASIVNFSRRGKISRIHEYKMSQPAYEWNGLLLATV